VRALSSGALNYVTKPFDPDDLVAVVARTINGSPEELEANRQVMIERCGGPD